MFDTLPRGDTNAFKGNRSSHYEIIRKIISLNVQTNPLINLSWSLFLAKLHAYPLIKNFTKNEYYPRLESRHFKSTSIFERLFVGLTIAESNLKLSKNVYDEANFWKYLWAENCQLFSKKTPSEMFAWVEDRPLIFKILREKPSKSLFHIKINS